MPENSTVLPLKVVMDKCSDARGERGAPKDAPPRAPWRRGSSAGCRGQGQNCFPAQEAPPARWGLPLPPMGQLHRQGHTVGDIEPEPVSHWQPSWPRVRQLSGRADQLWRNPSHLSQVRGFTTPRSNSVACYILSARHRANLDE